MLADSCRSQNAFKKLWEAKTITKLYWSWLRLHTVGPVSSLHTTVSGSHYTPGGKKYGPRNYTPGGKKYGPRNSI